MAQPSYASRMHLLKLLIQDGRFVLQQVNVDAQTRNSLWQGGRAQGIFDPARGELGLSVDDQRSRQRADKEQSRDNQRNPTAH